MAATVALPPGPKGHWLLGHIPELRNDALGLFTRCARDYGDFVPLRFGPKRMILLNHPDFVEYVLVSQHEPRVERYRKLPSGSWEYSDVTSGTVELSTGAMLDLAKLYDELPE